MLVVLALGGAAAVYFLDIGGLLRSVVEDSVSAAAADATVIASDTASPVPTHTLTPTDTAREGSPVPTREAYHGTVVLADFVEGYSQILAVSPGDPYPRQVTGGRWNDREPAASPDGEMIAFRSDRNGSEDLFWMETNTQQVYQITSTAAYEGNPAWSPDGQWLCYELYDEGNFDIWISKLDGSELYTLTNHDAMDVEPSWNPAGRQIAFVSDRDGSRDIFLADLEDPRNRFANLTNSSMSEEYSPVFSPDGRFLAYSAYENGFRHIYVLSLEGEPEYPIHIGQGGHPAWSPDGRTLAAVIQMPNSEQLVTYAVDEEPLQPLGVPLMSSSGVAWMAGSLEDDFPYLAGHPQTASISNGEEPQKDAFGRYSLEILPDVNAPAPKLSSRIVGRFEALREHAAEEAGWDVLETLEQAFVGVNDPLPPGYAYNDWLYTGRAFALKDAVLPSGWAEAVRQDFGVETYWRIYIRVLPQDGSRGTPLRDAPWDFEARYDSDPATYDLGGDFKDSVPEGYYLDLTELARAYGFERLPALPTWRRYMTGARYNEFAAVDGLMWEQAMAEIYPPEALSTPTPYQTPTQTPTRTPRPTATPWWAY